jgi:hypothetical protein
MPDSLRRLLESVNSMIWQQVFGLKDTPPRSRVYRMGVFRADGPPRCESAELVRWADGHWSWSAWVAIPETAFSVRFGGEEPNRKYAMRAAEKAFKRLCEMGYGHSVAVTKALLAQTAKATRH